MATRTAEEDSKVPRSTIADFERIVRAGIMKAPDIVVDPASLEKTFVDLHRPGIAKLVHYLANDKRGMGLQEFGSTSLGPALASMNGLYIGKPKLGISPLQWLAYVSLEFAYLDPLQHKVLDDYCEDFVAMLAIPPSAYVKRPDVF